jgi:hypothetical protein
MARQNLVTVNEAANVGEKSLFRRRRLSQLAEGTLVIRSASRAGSFVPLNEINQPAPEVIRFRERLIGPETLGSIEISGPGKEGNAKVFVFFQGVFAAGARAE